jgi:hypothetical protein
MKCLRLTVPAAAATSLGMKWAGQVGSIVVLLAGSAAVAGCISVNAPDKPIVIELNINIKQEVVYRLADDVKQNIDANPDIF